MDFDSSSKFIASLAKFLQSLCNGYVDFDKGVEVIGHIYINVDSDTGKKVDYVLNEKVCKNDNSITFISNSFHAQPAEKPKPAPKKAAEPEKQDEDTVVMEDSGPVIPNSTNYGTVGALRNSRGGNLDPPFTTGSKRPRTPPLRRNFGKGGSPAAKQGMSPSTRFQDSGGPIAKMGRTDIPPSPSNSNALGSSEDYENPNVFQSGGEEDDSQNFSSNFLDDQNSSEVDQKPVIDPDISIVKEEYLSNQQSSCSYAGNSQTSGPGRGKSQQSPAYPVMIHPNPSNYSGSTAASSHQADTYSSSLLESAGDPSSLTRAQQEELEMYYRKGTDQHLTFLRNMREAHAMYPFTGKRDKELFDKALAEILLRMPIMQLDYQRTRLYFSKNSQAKLSYRRCRDKSQFKSPGQGPRGQQYGRQSFHGGQGYPYQQGGYPGMSGHSGMERRMSSAGSEGDSFLQGPGEEGYDYQHLASDDSRDTQHSVGDMSQAQPGFHGAFGSGGQPGLEAHTEQQLSGNGAVKTDAGGGNGPPQSPPDIKVEVTPYPFMKANDFELIEIDPDDEDDI
ncbi:unnamed protein product [Lymnaea stagnalis]|uniref:Uncharacterized protein n=1 Tax=Lymnaea stagnalis TaxID=6523 RepID=A0AAV2H136_LYMST